MTNAIWELRPDPTRDGKPSLICTIDIDAIEGNLSVEAMVRSARENEGRIFSTEALIESESLSRPDVTRLGLPNDTDPLPLESGPKFARVKKYGWRKELLEVSRLENGAARMTIEFCYDLWSTHFYGDRL